MRLAYLSPEVLGLLIEGFPSSVSLKGLIGTASRSWSEQSRLMNEGNLLGVHRSMSVVQEY
jgi:hypothetical protein